MASDYRDISSLVIEITEYFETHPHAADSLDGIAKWWLVKRYPPNSKESVQRALEYLCDEGLVVKTKSQSGNVIYSRTTN